MELMLLSQNLVKILAIDLAKSFIWTDRFNKYGDFELFFSTQSPIYQYIQKKQYLTFSDSDHAMIIENLSITTNSSSGGLVKASGRSLESILYRRIVWGQTDVTGNPQAIIKQLINDSIINPTDSDRKINNFVFVDSVDPAITGLASISMQLTGDYVYDVVAAICKAYGIGFKIYLDELNRFAFKLYVGKDRSQAQNVNPYVIFSPEYDNIISSEYLTSDVNEKNVSLVAGEGEGSARKTIQCGSASGLERREMFTDARDISSETDDGVLTTEQYNSRLLERGNSDLSQNIEEEMFSGQAETTRTYVYNRDFFLGDYIQTGDSFDHRGRSRISEFIFAAENNGIKMYPTFESA